MRWENSNCRESIWCCCRKGLAGRWGCVTREPSGPTLGNPWHQHTAGTAPQHPRRAARPMCQSCCRLPAPSPARGGADPQEQPVPTGDGDRGAGRSLHLLQQGPCHSQGAHSGTSREPQCVSHGDPAGALPGGSCCMEKCQHFLAQKDGWRSPGGVCVGSSGISTLASRSHFHQNVAVNST